MDMPQEGKRAYITKLLFLNASELASLAEETHGRGLVQKEIRLSMAAHLMAALSLEGAVNEIGQEKLGNWIWERAEKLDPAAKWAILPWLANGAHFSPGEEPVQTVVDLQRVRNVIAHPKGKQLGTDLILGHEDGGVERDVPLETKVADGDRLYVGYGDLLDDFNARTAQEAIDRTLKALRRLRESTQYEGLAWVDGTLDRDYDF
jgi:hypothetical protein